MAASNARLSGIHGVLIIIILINYLMLNTLSNAQEVAWIVLPAALWLSLYT
jgi:hypothetical protein